MAEKHYELLVIGWGKAGKTLAKKAAKQGLKVAVIERDPKMYGGTCINIGCLPTKALVHWSDLVRESDKLGLERDWSFNQRAFAMAQEHRKTFVSMLNQKNYHLLADEDKVDLYLGEASFVGPHEVKISGADGEVVISAEKIVINTGATARKLDIAGADTSKRVHDSTGILELAELPKRLLVVGGGFIGLEFASYFAGFGSEVEVYQFDDSWLPTEDADVAEEVAKRLEAQGVKVYFETSVMQVSDTAESVKVQFNRRGHVDEAEFDQVLVAAGRLPLTAGLALENAGVSVGRSGEVVVDEYLRTSQAHIWAAGDVKGGPQFTFVSLDDSRIILPQLLGKPGERSAENRPVFATCTFLNPPLARIGKTEKELRDEEVAYQVKTAATATIPKAHTIAETAGFSKILVGENDEILGATLFHHEAHEMINLLAMAINHGVKASALRDAIYTHPTYTESLNDLLA